MSKVKRIFNGFKTTICNPKELFSIISGKKIYINYIELVLTTYCTLNCKGCSALMEHYKERKHTDLNVNIKSLDKLLNSIDSLIRLRLLGGEPLCYPYLYEILKYTVKQEKIKRVTIVTNGTLLIKDCKVLELLKNEKCDVFISNYGENSTKIEALINQLKENNIKYAVKEENAFWRDYGDLECRNRTERELRKQFLKCKIMCSSIFNGKLYQCPRSSHGKNLGIILLEENDCVDLLDEKVSFQELRKKLYNFFYKYVPYVNACNYCNAGTKDMKIIQAGVQNEKKWDSKIMKKITVIIPMHNSSKHIVECIESVINQTYENIEIIIVDDASKDNCLEIVKKIKDNRIKIIELKENVGAGIARNKGIEAATGDYICFLDSDDFWALNKLEKQVKFMEDNNYTFVYTQFWYLKNGRKRVARLPRKLKYKQALKNHAILTSTVMLNREHLRKEEIYMPDIKRGQDSATWWNILKNGVTAYCLKDELTIYRVGEKSLSSNKFKNMKRTWALFKRENIFILKRLFYFFCYAFNASKRRMEIIKLFIKRTFDILFSLIGVILLIPISIIMAILNLITRNKGSVLYKHKRIGKNGKEFTMYKFRTMYDGADKDLEKVLNNNEKFNSEWNATYKLQKDPRVTKTGRFLRKTSIDEIPQFINVLKGDMSIVGPRPVTEKEIERFGIAKDKVLSMKPGITGYWATHGRTNTTYYERVKMEEKYVDEFSLFLDIRIMLKTIITVIRKEGAI